MKISEVQQRAIDEVAKQVYLAEKANKAKGEAADTIRELVEKNEAAFRAGIGAKFEVDGRKFSALLVMKPSPRWQIGDLVVRERA